MTTSLSMRELSGALPLPACWPVSLRPEALNDISAPTPFLATDLQVMADRIDGFRRALPGVQPFYAVKCNSIPEVLTTARDAGLNFEIASAGELEMLAAVGVPASDVLYSNTVKPAEHIQKAAAAGVWRFAIDSEGELHKVAANAPGSAVYVRVRVDDSNSVFPLSRKFGAEFHHARALLQLAGSLGLQPYGLTFHVGSQCTTPTSFVQAIASVGRLMRQLLGDGITLAMLDIGGGFPARYADAIPGIAQIGDAITSSLAEHLPYRPELVAAEPGRHLVAETAVMAATVLGREERAGEEWLYLDVGAYHGLMETHQTVGQWRFPLWTSRCDHSVIPHVPFTVTGPTCDSADTMFYGAPLPVTMAEGDRVYIASTGAYTLSYASRFNGFPPPEPFIVRHADLRR